MRNPSKIRKSLLIELNNKITELQSVIAQFIDDKRTVIPIETVEETPIFLSDGQDNN